MSLCKADFAPAAVKEVNQAGDSLSPLTARPVPVFSGKTPDAPSRTLRTDLRIKKAPC